MKLKVDDEKQFMTIVDSTELEYDQLVASFTKTTINWGAVRAKKPGAFKGYETCFVDRFGRIPIGLWSEVQKVTKKYMFNLEIEGIDKIIDKTFDDQDFFEWVNTYFEESEKPPRDYQIEGICRVLKFQKCTEEISMSGGKTLMAFMLFRYMFDKGLMKRMLYVVPSIGLVTQTEAEFYEHEDNCNKKPNWTSECVYGGAGKNQPKEANIVIGTFQSLTKKNPEYFKSFDAVFIDETHHASTTSIKNIILKCQNSKYNVGMTGTLPPENSMESFMIQCYLGPCVYLVRSADLISNGFATPVKVVGVEMDYLDEDVKKKLYELRTSPDKDGAKLLNLEKDILRENRKRLVYVCETIAKSTKNALVLFADIKNDYGRTVFNWLKENTEKTVYYIDGGTRTENREHYKKQMELEENVIIVASVGVFSEGISINNLHSIFIIESAKSEYMIRQMLGRGMRLMAGKEVMTVVDFRDNFIYGSNKYQRTNYLMRHAKERERIYSDKKFPFKSFSVKL